MPVGGGQVPRGSFIPHSCVLSFRVYVSGQAVLVLFWAYFFVAAYSFGYGPICNIVTSEIYPTKVRARATSVGAVSLLAPRRRCAWALFPRSRPLLPSREQDRQTEQLIMDLFVPVLLQVCGQTSAFMVAMSFVSVTETIGLGATFFLFGIVGACTT